MFREPRKHDDRHLDFIRSLSCVICGDNTTTEAAHIRFSDVRAAKRPVGKQEKPDDRWAIPLCGGHHREQHKGNEVAFWIKQGIDPIFVALALHSVTGDFEKGEMIIATAKEPMNFFQRADVVANV